MLEVTELLSLENVVGSSVIAAVDVVGAPEEAAAAAAAPVGEREDDAL